MAGLTKAAREERARLKQLEQEQGGDTNETKVLPNQNNNPMSKTERKTTHFDKYLVRVYRVPMRRGGKSIGKTTAVKIDELLEENKPQPQMIIDRLNAAVDHRNPCDNGFPMIMHWFPAGEVEPGQSFIAEDIYHDEDDMEIIGFKIHTDQECTVDKTGKVVKD